MKKVEDILDDLGIRINLKGYQYWITAINLYMKNKKMHKIDLYKQEGKIHNVTVNSAERALRYAYKDDKRTIQKYFNVPYKIDNSILLELITREMEKEHEYKGICKKFDI